MTLFQTVRRTFSNAWLAAAPLVIILLIIAALIAVMAILGVIRLAFGPDAADTALMNAMTVFGMVVVAAPVALAAYGLYRLALELKRRGR